MNSNNDEDKIYITSKKLNVDALLKQKMIFIFNSLEDGWTVKKKEDKYIFTKPHNKSKEILMDSYLKDFLKKNFEI